MNESKYRGMVDATYWELRKVFGEPSDKFHFETVYTWHIKLPGGLTADVYDYKQSPHYYGKGVGTPARLIKEWHVHSPSAKAMSYIKGKLNTYRKSKR